MTLSRSGPGHVAQARVRRKGYRVRVRHVSRWKANPLASKPESESPSSAQFSDITPDTLVDEEEGQDALFHMYQSRYDSRGDPVVLQIGSTSKFEPERLPSHSAALVLTRFYSETNTLEVTILAIRSPFLKKALKESVKYYPGTDLTSNGDLELRNEPWLLFHYRDDLLEYARTSKDPKVLEHIKFCLQYVDKLFCKEIMVHESIKKSVGITPPVLEFSYLWILFKPGDLMYERDNDRHAITRLVSIQRREPGRSHKSSRYCLIVEQLRCNGTNFGFVHTERGIDQYNGSRALSELSIYPLQYHAEETKVRSQVLQRGQDFVSMYGTHHKVYKTPPADSYELDQNHTLQEPSHRVILDWQEYYRVHSPPQFANGTSQIKTDTGEHLNLKEEEYLISHWEVPGYCLTHKEWSQFTVDGISDIDFNTAAFDSLVLSKIKKDLIISLITVQETTTPASAFDDLIAGKGKGLIFLLDGPPGVGKTLTAESIAEYTKRPLFNISCADIGTSASQVEASLKKSLTRATKWNCVVLLDEADVFMEERFRENIHRNELVSVLLRTLEYFEGIMFLTTNRATSIDPAFQSRIHLSISYPPLSFESRLELWKTFVSRSSATGDRLWLTQKALNVMAKAPTNGRQIKNIVRIAHCRAVNGKREMIVEDIMLGLQALQSFESEFSRAKEAMTKKRGGFTPRVLMETVAFVIAGSMFAVPVMMGIFFGVWKFTGLSLPAFN